MRHFVEELGQLQAKLLEMSFLTASAIDRSVIAVIEKDENAAQDVLKYEARINQIEIEIDDFAVNLLALQQPMAKDLRLIVSTLKMNTDLERMGDLAVNIAKRAVALIREPDVNPMLDIPQMAALVQSMVQKALDAFVARDADLARSVLSSDDSVDSLRAASFQELISFMEKDPQNVRRALDLLGIVRHLERIADHATNIAEDVVFLVKGVNVRRAEVRNKADDK